ncbi:CHAT domain-containing protein [Winogradskyella flava]|uniref:CHAT domain-containing protein n=1 Tax=Winogradskyella flava TaxID=1884876 RepID=A0A842IU09_9FLAO|nr:CHAT domain-containing tetratricopeptide repeat protein [Winogradskyella flava]MBC2846540.1 CHAT domain-containing protein [Winogradskyella flava]
MSQATSQEFTQIKNSDSLTAEEKNNEFYKLIKKHKQQGEIDFLINDTFEITRWQWIQQMNWENNAIELCRMNVALMDSLKMKDSISYRRNLYGLGYYQLYSYRLEDALVTYKQLLALNEQDGYVLRGAHDIAEIYFITDRYYLSRDYFKLSQKIAENRNNFIYEIKSVLGIAQANKLINSPQSLEEGINTLSEVIKKAEEMDSDPSSELIIDLTYFHQMYIQLGNLYIDRIDYDFENGKKHLDKALEIALEINSPELLNKTYNDLGVLYLKDEKKEAQFYLKKALRYDAGPNMKSLVHRNLSKHNLFFKNYEEALYHIQKSLGTLIKIDSSNSKSLPTKSDLIKSETKFQLISGLMHKANIWIELSEQNLNSKEYHNDIFKTLNLADFLADQIRLENIDNRSKLFWRKTASEIYLKATKASFLLNEPERAFYYMEKNKALLLLEDISLKSIRNSTKVPENIAKQELKLNSNIIELERLRVKNNSDSIQRHLLLAKENYSEFLNDLSPEYKFYFKTLEPAKVIDFNNFRKDFLKAPKVYIEYIIPEDEDDEGYGLILTSSKTHLFEIKDCKELKELVIEYRNLIDTPFRDKESIERFKKVSNSLYRLLFPDEIKPFIKDKTLTIVPDYYLQNIPFESLTTSDKELSYLIYTYEINYSYSLTFLSENRKIERNNANNIVAIAPLEFPEGLTSLPNSKEELRFIDQTFDAKILLKENASKANFFKETNNYNVLHIASHANANDSISPWIALYDQKVTLEDIYKLKTSAELVVLSACNTSLGELHHGEGVMSLSRGFFNSGSHSVMPTLWEVNDKATLKLVNSFYTNLSQNQDKSLALHNAKLEYLKTNSLSNASPYYWASFILIGDTGTIEMKHNFPVLCYYLLGLLCLILVFFLFRRK